MSKRKSRYILSFLTERTCKVYNNLRDSKRLQPLDSSRCNLKLTLRNGLVITSLGRFSIYEERLQA